MPYSRLNGELCIAWSTIRIQGATTTAAVTLVGSTCHSSYIPHQTCLLVCPPPPTYSCPVELSELRMLKAIVDEDGTSALMLKDLYLSDRKKTAQLLETFPLSSVLKKVRFNCAGGLCRRSSFPVYKKLWGFVRNTAGRL